MSRNENKRHTLHWRGINNMRPRGNDNSGQSWWMERVRGAEKFTRSVFI